MRDIIIQAYYQQSFIFRITRRAVGVCAYTRNAAAGRAVGRRAPEPLLHAGIIHGDDDGRGSAMARGQCCSHTHAHTHTHTHTPTHTGEILGKRTLVLGACFLAICLASAGVMWGFSLRHKLTRNCDVFCDVCLEVFTIQCVVLILQIVQKEL